MRRRTRFNDASAELVRYLTSTRGLTQADIAAMLEVDKSFVSRVANAEREFSPTQMSKIADKLGVPMGAMLIDASPSVKDLPPDRQQIVDLCDKLMRQADEGIAAFKAQRKRA